MNRHTNQIRTHTSGHIFRARHRHPISLPHLRHGISQFMTGYQASEMQHQVHGPSLDIWSCEIIGLRIFVPKWQHPSNMRVDFQEGVAMLGADDQNTPRHLLSQMLTWDSSERISASQALLHPCFSPPLEVSNSSTPPARKRHRKED